jgi:hypothetical protein
VYFLPNVTSPVDLFRFVEEVEVAAWPVQVYPVRAAGLVVAAEVHVAVAGDAVVVEALDHYCGIETVEDVVVPCVAMRVSEQDNWGRNISEHSSQRRGGEGRSVRTVGKFIKVINDIRQINLHQYIVSTPS